MRIHQPFNHPETGKEPGNNEKTGFPEKAGTGAAATAVSAPYVIASKKTPIKWRMQTYAGPALAEQVVKPQDDAFNKVANGEMVIGFYNADQLVPHGELFRALTKGTIDALQSDDDSIAAYFPLASRYRLCVPVLWNWCGLNEIWEEAYSHVKGSPG